MKRFFSFIIRQTVAVVLAVAFIIGLGIFCTGKMAINLLPDINVPMVCVQIIYPGANASSVEKDVTEPLEEGLSSLGGITKTESYSYDNLSAVVLSFDYGTDTDGIKADITSRLPSLGLPDGVQSSVYDIDLNAEALAVVSVTSEKGETERERLDSAYKKAVALSARFSALDGVEKVEIKGGAEYSYLIRPFGGLELLSPLFVEAFSYGALDLPLGNIGDDGSIQVRNNSDVNTEEDIINMPITVPASMTATLFNIKQKLKQSGVNAGLVNSDLGWGIISDTIKNQYHMTLSRELVLFALTDARIPEEAPEGNQFSPFVAKVGELADVTLTPQYSSYVYFADGVKIVKGAVVEVYKANGANSSAVVEKVKSAYRAESGEGYSITLLDDQSSFISDSVMNVLVSMLIGGALAVLVILLFLKKIKNSLIIAVTMPLSVLASLICLYLMGITLNMVSLGGLAVGIGMLVDNSIVVIECITKHRDGGKTPFEAAVDGVTEVGGALFGSTLTTVCVFIPIIFSGGLTAEIFTDLSFAVIFSLAFSLIVAVTVIPALYSLFAGRDRRMLSGAPLSANPVNAQAADELTAPEEAVVPKTEEAGKKKLRERLAVLKRPVIMNGVEKGYGKILPAVLGKKVITILVAIALFGASIGLLFLTGTEFLPSIDKGEIEVDMSYPANRSLDEVEKDVYDFTDYLEDRVENLDYISVSVGKNGLLALTDTGIITVRLTTDRHTDRVVEKIRAYASDFESERGNSPERTVTVRQIDGVVASLMSGSTDMSVTVVGGDNGVLSEIAGKIKARLAEEGFKDIGDSSTQSSTQYSLRFDRGKLASYGLDYQTIVMTLRIGLASYTACTVNIDGESYGVRVAFAEGTVTDRQSLLGFVIGSDAGSPLHLSDVLTPDADGNLITEQTVESCIRRTDGKQMISVSATLPGEDTGSASNKMQDIAAQVLKEYDGYSFRSSGISSYLSDAFKGLAVALVISFFLLYAVMAVQFGSAVKPLIIMASIPFSFTGGFLALVITGTSLNVVSFIGLIMLMGVVVNNAIVMLEKIKQLHTAGMTHFDAVTAACKERLRPILMTTLTTILALIPLAVGVGSGSELMQPLGIVVIGGLLIGTLVTLALVPTVYCAVNRLSAKFPEGKKGMRKAKRKQKDAESAAEE